jgi:hypothetical protein
MDLVQSVTDRTDTQWEDTKKRNQSCSGRWWKELESTTTVPRNPVNFSTYLLLFVSVAVAIDVTPSDEG